MLDGLQGLVWISNKIVFCTALEYTLFDPVSGQIQVLLSLQEDAISKTVIAKVPGMRQALLLMVSNISFLIACSTARSGVATNREEEVSFGCNAGPSRHHH